MKKIYFFIALIALTFSAYAQIPLDDIEGYALGPVHQNHWSSWSGNAGAEDGIVTTDVAASGTQSIAILEGQTQDCVLDLGNKTIGAWALDFNMYVNAGSTGYFNLQNVVGPSLTGTEFNIHVQFNEGSANPGAANIYNADGTSQGQGTVIGSFTYTENTWFHIRLEIDIDAATYNFLVDGTPVFSSQAYFTNGATPGIGGIDFFSVDANNRYYIDDVSFEQTNLSINDISNNLFSVYPNPVENVLNFKSVSQIDTITIYNVLGKVVAKENPQTISPSIDMSKLSNGIYLVEATSGNTSKTVKIIK